MNWRGEPIVKMSDDQLRQSHKECQDRIYEFECNPNANIHGPLYARMRQTEHAIGSELERRGLR